MWVLPCAQARPVKFTEKENVLGRRHGRLAGLTAMAPPPDATLIGIDCATETSKVGLALATWAEGACVLQEVGWRRGWPEITETVAEWCTPNTLIALDAPLGWPTPQGSALAVHVAGTPLEATANALFRRATDDVVAREVSKRPLDVGADRIERTAHRALAFLGELRTHTGLDRPLAWGPGEVNTTCAVEVYPAATLEVRGLSSKGYKGTNGTARRGELVTELRQHLRFGADSSWWRRVVPNPRPELVDRERTLATVHHRVAVGAQRDEVRARVHFVLLTDAG